MYKALLKLKKRNVSKDIAVQFNIPAITLSI